MISDDCEEWRSPPPSAVKSAIIGINKIAGSETPRPGGWFAKAGTEVASVSNTMPAKYRKANLRERILSATAFCKVKSFFISDPSATKSSSLARA